MQWEKRLDDLLLEYGIKPSLVGKRYFIHILRQIHNGAEISPTLITETAQEFSKSRSGVHSALRIIHITIIDRAREKQESYPAPRRNSFYEFLHWFYQKTLHC